MELAAALSTITGVAISPLLGLGAVGAYDYYTLPPERHHWFANPYFWVPALLIVLAVFLKDAFGPAAPGLLKKPFDLAETFENKISALIAAGLFVPLVVSVFPVRQAQAGAGPLLAMIDGSDVLNGLMTPVALAVFGVVWLVFHTTHVLILLSPFATVDALLKLFRLGVMALLTAAALVHPYLGAALAVVLIGACYLVSGWAFRLMVLGEVFCWDILTWRRRRFQPAGNGDWMFTARPFGGAPVRSYGRLLRDQPDGVRFEYRPWLVLPKRVLKPAAPKAVVGRGLFYSQVLETAPGQGTAAPLFLLPPRYWGHEESVARGYGFIEVCDAGLLRGIKGLWRWLTGRGGVVSSGAAGAGGAAAGRPPALL